VSDTVLHVHGAPLPDGDGIPVAVCQLAPRIGNRDENLRRVEQAVLRAAEQGARLVVLPELVTSGYVFRDAAEARSLAEPADGPTVTRLTELARKHGLVVVAGIPEAAGETLYNSAVLVDGSGLRATYRKAHLWHGESDIFTPGSARPPVVETDVGRVGMVVCYDLEFPEWMRQVALDGADIVCAPTNWPHEPRPEGERPIEVVRVQASAAVNRTFIAVADRAGSERGVSWVSGSAIVSFDGYPLGVADDTGDEQIVLARCEVHRARNKRTGPRNDVFADRRTDLYRGTLE
jgi:5-aminopentanamidase